MACIGYQQGMAQYDPKALEILDAMSKKYKSIPAFEATLVSTLINESAGVKDEFTGKITVKGDKYRLLLEDQEVINNGTKVWTVIFSAKEVSVEDFDPKNEDINPAKIFEMYKKGFKYLYLGDKTENGLVMEEIDLVSEKKSPQYFKIKMMINKRDKLVNSFTMFDRSGNRFRYTISKFLPNSKMDDANFVYDPKKYPGFSLNE